MFPINIGLHQPTEGGVYVRSKILTALLIAAMLVIAMHTVVLAQSDFYDSLEGYVAAYNENLDKVPGLAKRMFANERINFYIATGNGEEIIGVATDAECAILEFVSGEIENPTIRAYIDGDVIQDLMDDFSISKALSALRGIRLEGVGFAKVIKVFFLNIVKSLAGLFG